MAGLFKFPSINRGVGYNYGCFLDGSGHPINYDFSEFDTYGDGMTQHSPGRYVARSGLVDYLQSLVKALAAIPVKDWPGLRNHALCAESMAFLAKLKYAKVEGWGNQQWYSLDQRKVTRKCMEHDRRFIELPEWADGRLEQIGRLARLSLGHASWFEILSIEMQTRRDFEHYGTPTSIEKDEDARDVIQAHNAYIYACSCQASWNQVSCAADNYQRKVEASQAVA